jgi:hypothetical protein
LPPIRIRPQSRGITAPSVKEVMRRLSSRWPSTRWLGASEDTIQLSTTAPTVEPIMPPMVAAETPSTAPPIEPPIAAPAAPRMRVAIFVSADEQCIGQPRYRMATRVGWAARPQDGSRDPLAGKASLRALSCPCAA